MKAQLITDVKGIRIELSIKEAIEAISKPKKVQDYIASMLNGAGYDFDKGDADSWFRCKCGRKFKTVRGLGRHKNSCAVWKTHEDEARKRVGAAALDAFIEEETA